MRELQIRYPVAPGEHLTEFECAGVQHVVIARSYNADLIPGHSKFQTRMQYLTAASDGKLYEVYIYYYFSRGDGRHYAVVDAIREY